LRAKCQACPAFAACAWYAACPTHYRVNARKVRSATRRLGERLDAYRQGRVSFGEVDASVKSWVNHVRYADTWGLRRYLFGRLRIDQPSQTPTLHRKQ
jgi:RNA-directed DNA polymerase